MFSSARVIIWKENLQELQKKVENKTNQHFVKKIEKSLEIYVHKMFSLE